MSNADTLRTLASATMDIDEREALYDGAGALEMREELERGTRQRLDGLRTYALEKAIAKARYGTSEDDVIKCAEKFYAYLTETSGATS